MKLENMTFMSHRDFHDALKEKNRLSVPKAKKSIAKMTQTKRTLTKAIKYIHYSLLHSTVHSFGQSFGTANNDEAIGLLKRASQLPADKKAEVYSLLTGKDDTSDDNTSNDSATSKEADSTDTTDNDSDNE